MNRLLHLFFPPKCIACGKILTEAQALLCVSCGTKLVPLSNFRCDICGLPIYEGSGAKVCGRCKAANFHFKKNVACFLYKDAARCAVLNLKFGRPSVMRPLADMLAAQINAEDLEPFDCVTYVAATRKKEQSRGYNQSALLARRIAKRLGVPYKNLLVKTRETKDQKSLSFAQRQQNVKGAYRAKAAAKDKTILVIDDIFTTGATLNECARALRASGAHTVYCATVTVRE